MTEPVELVAGGTPTFDAASQTVQLLMFDPNNPSDKYVLTLAPSVAEVLGYSLYCLAQVDSVWP